MLDADNAWQDLPTAIRYVERLEPYDPYWIEEPFYPGDVENHARLARSTRVAIATGEIRGARWHFKGTLDRGAAHIQRNGMLVLPKTPGLGFKFD